MIQYEERFTAVVKTIVLNFFVPFDGVEKLDNLCMNLVPDDFFLCAATFNSVQHSTAHFVWHSCAWSQPGQWLNVIELE